MFGLVVCCLIYFLFTGGYCLILDLFGVYRFDYWGVVGCGAVCVVVLLGLFGVVTWLFVFEWVVGFGCLVTGCCLLLLGGRLCVCYGFWVVYDVGWFGGLVVF